MTSARAIATRCCSPPESRFGRWSARSAETDLGERLACAARSLLSRNPRVDERQLDVLERGRAGEEVVGLEDEADPLPTDVGAPGLVQRGHLFADEPIRARRRPVEKAENAEQRRLPGAGRAHDGEELAFANERR